MVWGEPLMTTSYREKCLNFLGQIAWKFVDPLLRKPSSGNSFKRGMKENTLNENTVRLRNNFGKSLQENPPR